ncbi:hypothetical protein LINPERHAP1_LOCUS6044, partial [Linum perenne]
MNLVPTLKHATVVRLSLRALRPTPHGFTMLALTATNLSHLITQISGALSTKSSKLLMFSTGNCCCCLCL